MHNIVKREKSFIASHAKIHALSDYSGTPAHRGPVERAEDYASSSHVLIDSLKRSGEFTPAVLAIPTGDANQVTAKQLQAAVEAFMGQVPEHLREVVCLLIMATRNRESWRVAA